MHKRRGKPSRPKAARPADSRDVQQSTFCAEAVKRTVKAFGKLDIVVNNAAYQQHQESIEDISDEQGLAVRRRHTDEKAGAT